MKLYNIVKVYTSTVGTGTVTLGSAVPSFITFATAGVVTGSTVSYAIEDGNNREVGTGTYTSGAETLTRNVVTSTNSNNLITLSGNAVVFITGLAADLSSDTANTVSTLVQRDGSGNFAAGAATLNSAVMKGSSSGSTTVQASATASGTLTLPAATDTLIGKATSDTLTNKTFDTAGAGNVFRINGTGITAVTGSGSVVLGTSPTIATPTITTSATIPLVIGGTGTTSTLTLRSTSGVGTTGADIIFQAGNNGATEVMRLQNGGNVGIGTPSPGTKLEVFGSITARTASTQDSVILSGRSGGTSSYGVTLIPAALSASRTITLPDTTGTVVTTGDSGTVTSTMIADGTIVNGDISASAAIAVSKLSASTISGVTLGNNLNTLTLNVSGTGLSGSTTYNGSAAATFTVTSNATNANTASTIVARDASGNFSAGTITATLSGSATSVGGITEIGLFNNMGGTHGARTSFDATTPSYNFGYRYVQGSANGPGTSGTQFYSWYIGLGSEYPATGAGSYGAMFAVDRNVTNPYLSVRYNEGNSFSAWYKIRAGYADSAGTAGTVTTAAQGNITSVGTLTSLTVSGNISIGSLGVAIDSSKNFYPGNQTTRYIGFDGIGLGTYNSYFFVGGGYTFYSTGTTVLRGTVLNDTATYLQINGGTSGHTYFNGNVGVGISGPVARLQSFGAAQTSTPTGGSATGAGLYINNTDANYGMMFGISSDGGGWIQQQRSDANNTQYALRLNPLGGFVGIGMGSTNPGKTLDIISAAGSIRLASTTSSGYGYIELGRSATATNNWHFGSENDGTFRFYNGTFGAGSLRLYMTSVGETVINGGGGGLTIINNNPTITFQDTDGRSAFIHCNANLLYFLRGSGSNVGYGNWTSTNAAWPLVINLETNTATFGGLVNTDGTNSRFATGFDSGQANSMSCSNWFRSSGTTGWYNETYGGGIWMTDSTYVRVYNGKGFLVDGSHVANGQISARYGQSSGSVANAAGGLGGVEIYGGGSTNAAFLTFHRPGAYAVYFGLDGTDLKVGGWSMGAVAYTMMHSGNYTTYTGNIPQESKTSAYTLVAADRGKHISITTGGVTVPASVFNTGDIVTIFNNSGSNQTITQGASTTVRLAGTANTGNRTLAQYGVATVLCVASNTFVISGNGLT